MKHNQIREKVKFGKLSNIEAVNFSIPNLEIIQADNKNNQKPKIYLGTTGWSNKEWLGSYYPKKAKTTEFLSHYGKMFNTIELNTTHYQIPSQERVQTWSDSVDSNFHFCPKAPQVISHRSNLAIETNQSATFFKNIERFQHKLGPCFMQLPEHFAPRHAEQLLHFLKTKPKSIQFAIELRHKQWFSDQNFHLKALAKELISYNTALVISDVAGRRDACHGILSTPVLIIRLVGNSLHKTDYHRINTWIERIKKAQNTLEAIYVFFHQPTMEQIPDMVNYFIQQGAKEGIISPLVLLEPKYIENSQLTLF